MDELYAYKEILEADIQEKRQRMENLEAAYGQYRREFRKGKHLTDSLKKTKRNIIAFMRAIPAYLLGRRNFKQLYSRSYKQKDASNKLKKYKRYLYNLGFEDRALADLERLFHKTSNDYLRKAVAWELSLWYANKLDKETAELTLFYSEIALERETRPEMFRRGTIIQAEALDLLGNQEEGKKLIQRALKKQKHPDLYFSLANLEKEIPARMQAMNQALAMYQLAPVKLIPDKDKPVYNRLTAEQTEQTGTSGPKVTIIIPSYNAEEGIRIAIESLQKQTYRNLEILAVDDCSTDQTAQVIKEYAEQDSRIKFLSATVNGGPYIARNIALQAASGDLVTINDADDWSHPEKIATQVKDFIENPHRIANTSEHARVTEELKLYRRGMPGQYIFSNMSSLMFKRDAVLKEAGYWDSLRFAADSEFKKRLIKIFGEDKIADLKTGPLSLPMQSQSSLTGSSAFGYHGYLKGIRKEYAECQAWFHKHATSLYIPYPQTERPFPVPEPMWPNPEIMIKGKRSFDFVIASDFRNETETHLLRFIEHSKKLGKKIGLVQMGIYNLKAGSKIHPSIREYIDGDSLQMLVYGEAIRCDILLVNNPGIFTEKQKYLPEVTARAIHVLVSTAPKDETITYLLRPCARKIERYGKTTSTWHPLNNEVRGNLLENHLKELRSIRLSKENWLNGNINETAVANYIASWQTKENLYKL